MGLWNMLRDGSPNLSQTVMRWRVKEIAPDAVADAAQAQEGILRPRDLLRPFSGVACGVGICTGAGEFALVDNEILLPNRPARKIGLQDLARASGVARLR